MNRPLAIKSETDTTLTLEGWGVVFGGEDLTAEYFSDKTDFWLEQLGPLKMTLFDHGQDQSLKSTVLGSGTLERKAIDDGTEGLWFTAQLDKSVGYVKQVAKLAKAGVLGASSGAVSHLIERIQEDEKTWIKSWPIAEMSLTVTPCEPRTLGFETLKALIGQGEAAKAALAAAPRKAAADATKDASFEQIRDQIWAAVNRNENGPFEAYDADYSCVVATYPDFVIVERVDVDADGDGGLWRIAYAVDAAGQVTLGDAEQVQVAYTPITKSLVERAEALKALLPRETPAKGASQPSKPTQPTKRSTPEITVSDPTPPQEPSMPLSAEETTALVDGVSAKFAPQFDAISKILERFENEPALKSAGHISETGGTTDRNVKSFADWLVSVRRGDTKRLESMYATKAALAEDDGQTGGYLVPTEYRNELLKVAAEMGIVRSRATIVPMGAREVEIPALDQQTAPSAGNTAFLGGVVAKWAAEAGAYDETEPKFKMIRLNAHKLEGYTLSSKEMLADSAQALETLLRTLFGGAIAWYEDYAFLRGDGAGKPLGIQNAPATIAVTRAASGNNFDPADIGAMLKRLPASSMSNAVWVMHQFLLPDLIALSQSNPNVSWVSNFRESPTLTLMGLPILFSEKMATAGSAFDVLLADFRYYLLGDRQQIEIASSEHFKFTNGQTTWRFDSRVDGQPWLKSAITLSDASSTISPFVYLS